MKLIEEPFLNPDGSVNENCMAELNSEIKHMGKTYERLSGDSEWSIKRWTFKREITGGLAKWAIRQSGYACPDGLEKVVGYLDACLENEVFKSKEMLELSLCEINKHCWDILEDMKEFLAWNECKKGNTPDISFSCRYSKKEHPDDSFIDLDALLHNICLDIRMERRANDAFDKKFEEDHG